MPAELYSTRADDAQGTSVGGSKPLHRFIKGQPKIIGIVVMILGAAFAVVSVAATFNDLSIWSVIAPGFLLGVLFVVSGILFVLTEHNPTKKTVTMSLALSIITVLGSFWTIIIVLPDLMHSIIYRQYHWHENGTMTRDVWSSRSQKMTITVEAIFLFYCVVGVVIFIIMSTLAGTALRSSKSQAIIIMSSTPAQQVERG